MDVEAYPSELPEMNVANPASMEEADNQAIKQSFLIDKYIVSRRHGHASLQQTGVLFLDLIRTTDLKSSFLQEEIQNYTDALLDRNGADIFYLEVLAMLPPPALQDLIIHLVRLFDKLNEVQTRSALLFSLIKVVPAALEDDFVGDLIVQTCRQLLNEAKRSASCYCHVYRHAVVMKFLPLLLVRKVQTAALRRFYLDLVPDSSKFLMACALKTIPETESVSLTPEEIWDSVVELLSQVRSLCSLDSANSQRPLIAFWNTKRSSLPELSAWWSNSSSWKTHKMEEDASVAELNFFYQFAFWCFMLCWYHTLKSQSEIPERRPFLLNFGNFNTPIPDVGSPHAPPVGGIQRLMEEIFFLTRDVFKSLSDPENAHDSALFKAVLEELQLEKSAIYMTFRSDLAVALGSTVAIRSVELHPSWLKIQLSVANLNSSIRTDGLRPTVFAEIPKILSKLSRIGNSSLNGRAGSRHLSADPRLIYVWEDWEIVQYFCRVIVEHMLKQPLERVSDEFLGALLVFLQPILPFSVSMLRTIISAIGNREKFVFKKFFTYIVSADVLSEVAQLLVGTVVMDLTLEPLSGAAASVHKTRGANRGTTDALLLEMQKQAIGVSLSCNPYQAVALFVKNENLTGIVFQQAAVSPSRRGRSAIN